MRNPPYKLAPHVHSAIQRAATPGVRGDAPAPHVLEAAGLPMPSANAVSSLLPSRHVQAKPGEAVQPAAVQPAAFVAVGALALGVAWLLSDTCARDRGRGAAPARPNPRTTDLRVIAARLSGLHAYRDIATIAVVERVDGTYAIYTQRGYNVVRECDDVLEEYGIRTPIPFVESAEEADYNMHAEMLAVSEWLAGNQPQPLRVGTTRPICYHCRQVLDRIGAHGYGGTDGYKRNWANPYWWNDQPTPRGLDVPGRYRRFGRNYD